MYEPLCTVHDCGVHFPNWNTGLSRGSGVAGTVGTLAFDRHTLEETMVHRTHGRYVPICKRLALSSIVLLPVYSDDTLTLDLSADFFLDTDLK